MDPKRSTAVRRRVRYAQAFFLALLTLPSMLAGGCSDSKVSRARVLLFRDSLLTRDMIRVQMEDGYRTWTFGPDDFTRGGAGWFSPEVPTWPSGDLTMRFAFRESSGELVSRGSVTVELREDWHWSFDIRRSSEDPTRGCFGCFGSKSFPIVAAEFTASDSDSVWVVWGGNWISHPVLY